jgi:bifunctional non-homologous end joining protein LigD
VPASSAALIVGDHSMSRPVARRRLQRSITALQRFAVAATLLRARSFTLDGEAVVCGQDGVAVFHALHRRGTVTEAMLYAFDLLELDGEDLRSLPLVDRKKRLARLLSGRRLGIVLSDHTDKDGTVIFRHACRIGREGIVSKRLTAPYRSGPSKDWLKVKNPDRYDPGAGNGVVRIPQPRAVPVFPGAGKERPTRGSLGQAVGE